MGLVTHPKRLMGSVAMEEWVTRMMARVKIMMVKWSVNIMFDIIDT